MPKTGVDTDVGTRKRDSQTYTAQENALEVGTLQG